MRVLFDVDTQNDFMHKQGSLYIPGSEAIKPNITRLANLYLRYQGIVLCGSVDSHTENDKEFEQFPRHCIVGTWGWYKIPESIPSKVGYSVRPVYIPCEPLSQEELEESVESAMKVFKPEPYLEPYLQEVVNPIYFKKQSIDVFVNPNTERALSLLHPNEVVVYGVATEYCVRAAVLGMLKRGYKVLVVEDAIAAVNEEAGKQALEEMVRNGAILTTAKEIVGWLR
ncbi:hypothetical protein DRJ48_03630 [Candidatus Woesearchaeota archaeon]|nr:MAG: hypothetical protein DRJ48_03630 [Candidatus Woesearchaeota archaeon]